MNLIFLIISFTLSGLTACSNKAIVAMGLGGFKNLFAVSLWGTGVIVGLIFYSFTRYRMSRKDAIIGMLMGASGGFAMLLLVGALQSIDGVIAFPVRSCGNIVLTAAVSFLIWREKLTPRQWLGIILAVIAIYLLV